MQCRSKGVVRFISICVFLILIIMCNITFAHSGRTDSNGGHRDNKNKSGLGSYHYHCGGHPAHLHANGVCPYSNNSTTSTNKGNTLNSSATNTNKDNALNSSTTTNTNIENISNFSTVSTQVNEDKKEENSNTMNVVINPIEKESNMPSTQIMDLIHKHFYYNYSIKRCIYIARNSFL